MTRTAKRQRNKNLKNHRKLPKVNDFFTLKYILKFYLNFHTWNQKGTLGKPQLISYMGDEPDVIGRLMIR